MARLPGVKKGAPHALDDPGDNELGRVERKSAGGRGDGEPDHSDAEHEASPVAVTERSAQQQEGRQGKRVAGHDPLQGADRRREVPPDSRQRYADDRGVDPRHARAENGCGYDPSPSWAFVLELGVAQHRIQPKARSCEIFLHNAVYVAACDQAGSERPSTPAVAATLSATTVAITSGTPTW